MAASPSSPAARAASAAASSRRSPSSGAAVAFSFREREDAAREVDAGVTRGGRDGVVRTLRRRRHGSRSTAFIAEAAAALGPIDILVNNAGVTRDAHVMFLDEARWDDVLE